MNCEKFESIATELARGQMMAAEVLGEAQVHRAECTRCSSRLRDEEMLSRGLRSLAAEMNSMETPSSIETRLLSAFRRPQPQIVLPVTNTRSHRQYWLTAIAAVLLIVLGLVAIRWRGSVEPKPEQARLPQDTPRSEEVVRKGTPPQEDRSLVNNTNPPRRHRQVQDRRLVQAANRTTPGTNNGQLSNHANEVATDFMPLGYLHAASLQDGGQIVRVEVPRTTLASFGFPVNMDRYNERVKADVLVGVDGVAHAIRFVQEKRLQ